MHTLALPHVSGADEAFLARVRNADPEAIAEAYDAHHVALCSFARRLLCDDHAAEDLVQDVFLVLPRLSHKLASGKSLRSFLLGIAASRARHHLRALSRRRRIAERLGSEPLSLVEDPERLSQRRSLAARLERALDALSL